MKNSLSTIAVLSIALVVGGPGGAEEKPPKLRHENWGYKDADWTVDVPGWKAVAANEHPRLVFRQTDLTGIKKRAGTPEGRVMIERLNTLLADQFTLWHPAGNGLLFQLTGEAKYADIARQQCEEIIDRKKSDTKDARYGFTNPGSGGAMRAGPAIGAMGLAYDLNHDGWDEAFRKKVAQAILDNPFTSSIAANGPIMPSCNHYGAAVGGVGLGLLAIRGDAALDAKKIDLLLDKIIKQVRNEISIGYGDRGYYFEGHQCGRISSNTGLIPFLQAYRLAAGKDLISKKDNARWLSAKWIYEFAANPDGQFTNPQRGMYCRDFPRGGMWSENSDFCQGFGICPPEFVPALKWVYNHQIEPGKKTYDILEYPHQAIYALANWPLDVEEKNPESQPDLFPRVLHDTAAGYLIFRNGWSESGQDICVSVLLGTHPTHQNGRGMAAGGPIYVYGKGLGWAGQAARYRLPGMFHSSTLIDQKFEKDGSGVISALRYPELKDKRNQLAGDEPAKTPTSLAVDFSKTSGADLLVVMVGPQVGYGVGYWMNVEKAKVNDITGQDGYATKTTLLELDGQKACVMTLQKGAPPEVKMQDNQLKVGRQTIAFDGKKLILGNQPGKGSGQ